MFNKGKQLLTHVVNSVGNVKLNTMPKLIILSYIGQLFFLICIYIFALLIDFAVKGRFDYTNAAVLLKILVSGEMMLALGIICKGVYDANGNNVPDIAEKDKEVK
jgi:hypothetical protein